MALLKFTLIFHFSVVAYSLFAEGYLLTMAWHDRSPTRTRPYDNYTHHWKDSWTPWIWDEWTWHGWVDWTQWNQGHQWSEAHGDRSRGNQWYPRTRWNKATDVTKTKKSRGPWAAGVVAISMQPPDHCVCLVEKASGQLGFPKGGAEPAEASMPYGGQMATAMREWQEETNLPTEGLTLMDARAGLHVDQFNCHYFMAKWDSTKLPALPGDIQQSYEAGVKTSWPVTDDWLDKDPIIRAHWMKCSQALLHPMLSWNRTLILRDTVRYLTNKGLPHARGSKPCR